jgi:N-methylhydantoinase B
MFDRCIYPPRGRKGGQGGGLGKVSLRDGTKLRGKGRQTIPAGKRLVLEMPGGAGYGDPMRRDPESVALDVTNGLVSRQAAREQYGVAIRDDGSVDVKVTAALRQQPLTAFITHRPF